MGLRAYEYSYDEEKEEEKFEMLWENKNLNIREMAIGGNGALYVLHYTYDEHHASVWSLCILGDEAGTSGPIVCDAPYIITATVNCAKPEIILQAPTPARDRLASALQSSGLCR
jgi:hypothetical protein